MLDENILQDALKEYRKYFVERGWWVNDKENEKFKWQAIYHFQAKWDVNAEDFAGMLKASLSKTNGLLASTNRYPAQTIEEMAETAPEVVRKMFLDLIDESRDVVERIEEFKQASDNFREKYWHNNRNHFQDENAISTYLWLKYPDKYYIYKFKEVRNVSSVLKSDYTFKQGDYRNNLVNFYALYNELCDYISKDKETTELLKQHLNSEPDCYKDPKFKTLTVDVGFYISRFYKDLLEEREKTAGDENWYPSDYSPELTTQDWLELINDKEVFRTSSLEIMKRLLDIGGQATCTQLAQKYGEKKNFYMAGSVALAKRVAEKTGCPVMHVDDENVKWWPVLYIGKRAGQEDAGSYLWRLRQELKEALGKSDLSGVQLYAPEDDSNDEPALIPYTEEDFLSDVYMSQDTYHRLRSLLENKMNVILQGAPGVGKTFAAKRLAYSIMGVKDDSRIQLVQFHQNYSYEDFMMGYRPSDNGFELKYGIFYQFCQKAANRPAEPFFFLIDEINRGNISKIFGELMMLLEKDHRSEEVTLAYTGMPFSIPENVYLIGTMNTADRSLAMIDYALRRRFGFFEMRPGFDSDGFAAYQKSLDNETFDLLIEKVKDLNLAIQNDSSLGRGFCIGHSYFCGRKKEECTDEWMQSVVDYDIMPMLEEYWFDDDEKVMHWDNVLHGVFQ